MCRSPRHRRRRGLFDVAVGENRLAGASDRVTLDRGGIGPRYDPAGPAVLKVFATLELRLKGTAGRAAVLSRRSAPPISLEGTALPQGLGQERRRRGRAGSVAGTGSRRPWGFPGGRQLLGDCLHRCTPAQIGHGVADLACTHYRQDVQPPLVARSSGLCRGPGRVLRRVLRRARAKSVKMTFLHIGDLLRSRAVSLPLRLSGKNVIITFLQIGQFGRSAVTPLSTV